MFLFSVGEWSRTEKLQIVHCCHADPTLGHLGERKTYNRDIEGFTWKKVMKYVMYFSYNKLYCNLL